MQIPIGIGDGFRIHQLIGFEIGQRLLAAARLDALAHERRVDAGVDDEMRDVDVLRSQFARHALRHGAQAELGAGEGGIADAAAQARRRAREQDRALAMRQHEARGLAPREKAAITGHLPYFAEDAFGGLEDGEIHIGAGIEDADFKRRFGIGLFQERRDVFFLAGVEPARNAAPASGFDGVSSSGASLSAVRRPAKIV